MEKTLSFHMLQKEIETIESTLQFLKESFFTASFDQIFPWYVYNLYFVTRYECIDVNFANFLGNIRIFYFFLVLKNKCGRKKGWRNLFKNVRRIEMIC